MTEPVRPRILCVDDETQVLSGLARVLRRDFELVPEAGGAAALARLQDDRTFAVILSDMRMPGVNGAQLLSAARQLAPDAVRVLLTGHADLRSAIAAVNEGQVFRFLTKPCTPEQLTAVLTQAVEQHRLQLAERELQERTLRGSVQALLEVLALASPVAFGRATRVRRLVAALAELIGLRDRWQLEMAAMLSQIGAVTLPPDTAARYAAGAVLDPEEQAMVARFPEIALRLLGDLPRLDQTREILAHLGCDYAAGPGAQAVSGDAIPLGARLLRPAVDFDLLSSHGCGAAEALARLRARSGAYDEAVLCDLAHITGGDARVEIQELRFQDVQPGMIFVDDVRSHDGTLLVARGQEVTASLLGRIQNYWADLELAEPVRVTPPPQAATPAATAP